MAMRSWRLRPNLRRGAGVAAIAAASVAAQAQQVALCFGDSLTAGVGASSPAASYPAQLQAMLGGGWTVVSAGVGGETSGAGSGRIGGAIAAAHPSHVLICEGANDVVSAGTPAGTAANIQQMVAVVRNAGALPVVGTLPPRTDAFRSASFAFSDAIVQAAAAAGAAVADLEGAMIGKEAQFVGQDQLHLTDAGYRKMAAVFRNKLGGGGSGGGDGGGCFIATAVYGGPDAPELDVLRRVRDAWILPTSTGRSFVQWYYRQGPELARQVRRDAELTGRVRRLLDIAVRAAQWAVPAPPEASSGTCP